MSNHTIGRVPATEQTAQISIIYVDDRRVRGSRCGVRRSAERKRQQDQRSRCEPRSKLVENRGEKKPVHRNVATLTFTVLFRQHTTYCNVLFIRE